MNARSRKPVPRPRRAPPTAAHGPGLSRPADARAAFRSLLRVELLAVLRDRRAMVTAFVLPLLLYPLMFWIGQKLETLGKQRMENRLVGLALDLRALDEGVRTDLLAKLREAGPADVREVDASLLQGVDTGAPPGDEEKRLAEALLADDELLLAAFPPAAEGGVPVLRRWLRSTDEDAIEADSRAQEAIDQVRLAGRQRRMEVLLGGDPGARVLARPVDTADPVAARGKTIGLWAPLVLLFTLIGAASWVALAAFAGEREAGTLETLLVQPVQGRIVAWAKFAVVVVFTIASLLVNAFSFRATASLGFVSGMDGAASAALGSGTILAVVLVFLPCTLLACAVLCLATARAKTFREGQNLLLPLMLAALVPMVPLPGHDELVKQVAALLPFAGSALAVREVLGGSPSIPLVLAACASQLVWSWFAVQKVGRLLDGEKALMAGDAEREAAARAVQSRRALRWTIGAIFAVYVVGGMLQAWNLPLGLALTLWGIALPLAVLSARGTARRAGETLREALGLARFAPVQVLGALLAAPALALGASALFELQQQVLPLPEGADMEQALAGLQALPLWAMLFLVAVSPAVCEELLFRGALLSGLRRDHGPLRTTLVVALLFGLVHASIYRFLPTGVLGAVLAVWTLRSASLWPAMALHCAYNGLLVLQGAGKLELPAWSAWLALPALALLLLPRRAGASADRAPVRPDPGS